MKKILVKLRETLRNPLTHEAMRKHMQDFLHELPLAKEETELEQPLCGTPNSFSLRQEEKDEWISMMDASLDNIERDMAHAKLYKEKTMSSDSEAVSPPRWAQ